MSARPNRHMTFRRFLAIGITFGVLLAAGMWAFDHWIPFGSIVLVLVASAVADAVGEVVG